MSTAAFLNAIQQQSAIQVKKIESSEVGKAPNFPHQPAPMQNYEPEEIKVTVDIVHNRKRLDVFFSSKPSKEILDSLKNQGFYYRPSDRAWYHQDNEQNRLFLETRFGASFVDSSDVNPSEDYTPEDPISDGFNRFRKQVDELIEHLGCKPADLMLVAIDSLHKKLFSKDS